MQSLSRILLVVERNQRVHAGLAKALLLARHTRACLELFLCDTALYCAATGRSTSQLTDDERQRNAHEYLRSLRQAIMASDVRIEVHATCESSLLRGVIDRLRRQPAQLVVRTRSGTASAAISFARQLVRSGTPIILTQDRPWQPTPRFVTALLTDPRVDGQQRRPLVPSMPLPDMLGRCCGARVDYVAASAAVLPQVVRQRNYDLVTVALTDAKDARRCPVAPVLRSLSCTSADVLLAGATCSPGGAVNADARSFARF